MCQYNPYQQLSTKEFRNAYQPPVAVKVLHVPLASCKPHSPCWLQTPWHCWDAHKYHILTTCGFASIPCCAHDPWLCYPAMHRSPTTSCMVYRCSLSSGLLQYPKRVLSNPKRVDQRGLNSCCSMQRAQKLLCFDPLHLSNSLRMSQFSCLDSLVSIMSFGWSMENSTLDSFLSQPHGVKTIIYLINQECSAIDSVFPPPLHTCRLKVTKSLPY